MRVVVGALIEQRDRPIDRQPWLVEKKLYIVQMAIDCSSSVSLRRRRIARWLIEIGMNRVTTRENKIRASNRGGVLQLDKIDPRRQKTNFFLTRRIIDHRSMRNQP